MKRPLLISLGVLALVGCLCLSLIGMGGVGAVLLGQNLPPTPSLTSAPAAALPASTPAAPTPQQTVEPSGTPAPTSATAGDPLPPAVASQMDQIQQQVVSLRGLQPSGPVPRQLLTRSQLEQKVSTDFFKDYTPAKAQDDVLVLSDLGLLPDGFDLYGFYQKLYGEQVAGFYDNQAKEMFVVAGEGFGGSERMTFAHEYTHALQDQNYDMENGLNYSEEKCKEEAERCAGIQALVEGDATLVEQEWLRQDGTPQDLADLQAEVQSYSSPVYDSAPAYMQQDFLFPYRYGLEFVQSLYDRGGWKAIDNAYRSPPLSTEQIIHPERYPADGPVAVSLPDLEETLGADWRKVDQSPLGEWYTYLVLAYGQDKAARLPERLAQTATEGWAGDGYAAYANDRTGASALVVVSDWDAPKEAEAFTQAFSRYGEARWGQPASQQNGRVEWQAGGETIVLVQAGAQTRWVTAPDLGTAQSILDKLG